MTLAQAKKNLRDAEKLAALKQKGLALKTALEIANRVYEVASNMVAPGATSHVREWLGVYCDAKSLVQELAK